jgi:hypothetical protein
MIIMAFFMPPPFFFGFFRPLFQQFPFPFFSAIPIALFVRVKTNGRAKVR